MALLDILVLKSAPGINADYAVAQAQSGFWEILCIRTMWLSHTLRQQAGESGDRSNQPLNPSFPRKWPLPEMFLGVKIFSQYVIFICVAINHI